MSTELASQEEGLGLLVNRYAGPGDDSGPHRLRYLIYVYDPDDPSDEGSEVTITRRQADRLLEALKDEYASG